MDNHHPKFIDIAGAVEVLRAGSVCAFPTDTVMGLGARADNSSAVTSLFRIKQRPLNLQIIALCADLEMADKLVDFSPISRQLANFWPGPLTLVLPKKPNTPIADEMNPNTDFLGVRIANSDLVQQLVRAIEVPLATTSANISGRKVATSPADFARQFGQQVPVIKTLNMPSMTESTILKVENNAVELLREGALSISEIEEKTKLSIKL